MHYEENIGDLCCLCGQHGHLVRGSCSRIRHAHLAPRRIAAALEKAYGQKLPDVTKNLTSGKDRGIPAAYDTRNYGENQHYVAYGAVGTLIVSIEYAEPRYALREGKYELVFKGGVKFSVSRAGWMK